MSDVNNTERKIKAQAFDAPGLTPNHDNNEKSNVAPAYHHARLEVVNDTKWWHSQFNLMLSVFALLVIAALLFVVLSPAPLTTSEVTLVERDGSVSQSNVAAKASNSEQAPWDEARRAQARTDSQDILSGLLSSKKILEAQGVKQWAGDAYTQALEQADLGDEFYKQQDYRSAINAYQSAVNQIQSLQTRLPEILAARISDGFEAIEQGKSILAKQLFQQALAFDKNSIPALKGLGRAETLDQVLDLYAQGQQFEQRFQTDDKLESLSLATQRYQQALELDKDYTLAQQGIDSVVAQEADKRYRQFMTTGFNNLFARKYSSAKSAFSKALKVKPNESIAKDAYTQSLSSNRSASLSSLLNAAKKYELSEQWGAALSNYQAVLQRDANQVSAKLGQIRSRARSDLDDRLVTALSDPLGLSRASIREKAEQALSDARGITQKGSHLKQQISQLELALGKLNQTIKIAFSSDAQTEISLIKVGSKRIQLGKFTTKKLALKPGRYVVRGTRLGFQDVRKEIDVLPGSDDVKLITIRCTEPINRSAEIKAKTRFG